MAKACIIGRTGVVTKGVTWKIKSTALAPITGLMAVDTKGTGHLVSSMGKAST